MARWRLTAKHYLNVPGTEWEQKEIDTKTGKQARKIYLVNLHLDPEMPADHNYPGEIIVCLAGKGHPRDIVFEGDPTVDMEPLDAEAEAISAARSKYWIHPIDSLPAGETYGDALVKRLEQMIVSASKQAPTPADATIAELMAQVRALTDQVAALSVRKDDDEPLEDVLPTPAEFAASEKRAAQGRRA